MPVCRNLGGRPRKNQRPSRYPCMTSAARQARLLLLLCALPQAGGFGYASHTRGGPPAFSRVAINKEPRRKVRWSYVCGLFADEWTPIDCVRPQPDGACAAYAPVCDNGVGRVEVTLAPYSVPLLILTLGMA